MLNNHNRRLGLLGTYLLLFSAPCGVCTISFGHIEYLTLPISILLLFFGGYLSRFSSDKFFRGISRLFYLPMVIAALWAILKMSFINNLYYFDYIGGDLLRRMIHIILYYVILLGIVNLKINADDAKRMLKCYGWGVIIILAVMGFWQIANALTGVWCPELETRNHLYFALDLGIKRITSFADEPSYLSPFLIDGILLFLFLRKHILAFLLFVLLGFSLSFGGYTEFFLLTISFSLLNRSKAFFKLSIGVLVAIILLFSVFPNFKDFFIMMLESRAELQSDFEMDDSGRTKMILQPVEMMINGDLISALIGNGPSSLKYIYSMKEYGILFVTSNNIYVDLLYEGGIIGVVCFVLLMCYCCKMFAFTKNTSLRYELIIIKLFIIHIILSSMYRADYSSARYTCLFILIICFYKILYTQQETMAHT